MTKKEIIATLKENGVKFNSKATKEELEQLLSDTAEEIVAEYEEELAEEEAVEEEAVEEEAVVEEAKAEKKPEQKKANKVVYTNYTSKKNLLKDHSEMETPNNQEKIFHNGFTYSITEDGKYVAVTYYFSKGAFYKYGLATLDEDMQVVDVAFKDSIKEVKAAIKAIYYPEAEAKEEPAAVEEEA